MMLNVFCVIILIHCVNRKIKEIMERERENRRENIPINIFSKNLKRFKTLK